MNLSATVYNLFIAAIAAEQSHFFNRILSVGDLVSDFKLLKSGNFIGIGICLGTACGVAMGIVFGDLALGISSGVLIGFVVGALLSKRRR